MKRILLLFAVLVLLQSCAEQLPETITASAVAVVYAPDNCQHDRSVGEGCMNDCDCRKPAQCILNTCQLVKQEDGSLCKYDQQCKSGRCIGGKCSLPGPTAVYECRQECGTRHGSSNPCYTVCRYRKDIP